MIIIYNFFRERISKKNFYISLLIGCIISLYQIQESINPKFQNIFFDSPYTKWISIDSFHISPQLFFLLISIISSIACSMILREDVDNGLFHKLKIKKKFSTIITGYFFTAFIIGFLIVLIPLILNFICYLTILPNLIPNPLINSNILVIKDNTLLFDLYYSHPEIHVIISILFTSLWGGLFSMFAMVNSLILKNKYLGLCSGFILQMILMLINTVIKLPNNISYVPSDFLRETASASINIPVTMTVTFLMLIYIIIMFNIGGKNKIVW